MTSETFRFDLVWQVVGKDRTPRDWSRSVVCGTYGEALEAHQRACAGRWVEPWQVRPQVTDLVGDMAGRVRVIRDGMKLWRDDRPGLSREEFRRLRAQVLGAVTVDREDAA